MSRAFWPLVLLLLASGCFLAAPDSLDWADDDTSADDDDTSADDDDTSVDDDDSSADDDDLQPDDDDGVDLDGDGYAVPEDCNDADATVHPGALEIWDFQRNDCEGEPSATEVLWATYPDGAGEPGAILHTGDWEMFGSSWSLGDLNGDGAEDLCARAQSDDNSDIYVFLDIDSRLATGTVLTTLSANVRVSPSDVAPGEVDCSRDLHLDGFDDLVFTALDAQVTGSGGIYVYDGSAAFGGVEQLDQFDASATALAASSRIGRCWGIGQLDDDDELEIVFAGFTATAGGDLEDTLVVATPGLVAEGFVPIAQLDSNFPSCDVVDDLSGDGTSEIFIHDGDARLVLGENHDGDATLPTWGDGLTWHTWWAESAVAADITGSGDRELIMGNPYWDHEEDDAAEGAVMIYFGRSGEAFWQQGLEDGDDQPNTDRMVWIQGVGPASALGAHVCPLGDPSGDNVGDFAVSAPTGQEDGPTDGEALVFEGRSEADWKALADGIGRITPGKETSRFMGSEAEDVTRIGYGTGSCGYTRDSELADPPRIWWMVWGQEGRGALLYWDNQRP
jgi:hypothetical protein